MKCLSSARSAFPKRPVCEMGGKDSLGTRACLRLLGWRWGDREAAIALLSLYLCSQTQNWQTINLPENLGQSSLYLPPLVINILGQLSSDSNKRQQLKGGEESSAEGWDPVSSIQPSDGVTQSLSTSDYRPDREAGLFCQVMLRHRKGSRRKAKVPIPGVGSSLKHPHHHPRWIPGKPSEQQGKACEGWARRSGPNLASPSRLLSSVGGGEGPFQDGKLQSPLSH